MTRVAFVVQRCGEEVVGGAEALCLAVAERLGALPGFDVTILTTCARDYRTWADVYPAGHSRVRGVHVLRFPVDRTRDIRAFDALSARVRGGADPVAEEAWMRAQGPISTPLRRHVERFREHYDAFVFFGYLYATTYDVLPLVEDRAILVPLAHDEWPIRLGIWEAFFDRPAAFVYNTPEERSFVASRFPEAATDGPIAGIGVEPPADVDAERFRARHGIAGDFALYLGRIDPSKGCGELVRSHLRARERRSTDLDLVLVGEIATTIPEAAGVRVVGPVDAAAKWDALAAARLVVSLSPYESLSIATLEGWAMGKAAIVSSRASALVGQCRRSGGGIWVANDNEYAVALELLDTATMRRLGRQGSAFVADKYRWTDVLAVYATTLELLVTSSER